METRVKTIVAFTVSCELTENELRALDALVGYGFKSFMDVFKEKLGKAYIGPFERDLQELFAKIESLRPEIHIIDEARKKLGLSKVIKGNG